MAVEAHQRTHIEQAINNQKKEFENELEVELQQMEAKNTQILNTKAAMG